MDEAKNMALLFFMDHLMQKNGRRTIHDLSCQFGARGFTAEMRDAVGTTQEGLTDFLCQHPSLFTVEGDQVSSKYTFYFTVRYGKMNAVENREWLGFWSTHHCKVAISLNGKRMEEGEGGGMDRTIQWDNCSVAQSAEVRRTLQKSKLYWRFIYTSGE